MPNKHQRHPQRKQRARHNQHAVTQTAIAMEPTAVPPDLIPTGPVRAGNRGILFAIVCAICVLVAGGAIAWAVIRDGGERAIGGPMDEIGAPGVIDRVSQPYGAVLFRNVLAGDHWNQMGIVPADAPEGSRNMVPVRCLRLHFAADRGLCLAEGHGPPGSYTAYILDTDMREQGTVRLGGLPSRTRVSPDARYGATTSFVTGHSYADGEFSTETLLINIPAGESIANLEEFTAFRDGQSFSNEDFNYWGVTFTDDSNIFYATLATAGNRYLVQGDIATREVVVLRENVECPSISPDNTRIAFKKQVGGDLTGPVWRFHVLDLATMTETPLAETRSIDDQIMWLDNDNVLYGDASDTWIMAADGSGEPRRFMSKAISPVIVPAGEVAVTDVAAEPDTSDPEADGKVLTLSQTDLGVTIDIPSSAPTGDELTYTITVTNHGPNEATWIVLDHYLPEGVTFESASLVEPDRLSYGCSTYLEEDRIRCDTLSLAPGSTWIIAISITPDDAGSGTVASTIGAAENDSNPDNDRVERELTFNSGE